MRLNELKGIKSYEHSTGEQLMMRLAANGVFKKKLGRGVFGYAFEISNNEVLKVWADDPGYEAYLEYCQKHSNNPYLLKIHGKVREFKMKNSNDHDQVEDMKFVRIEKLEIPKSLKPFGYNQSDYQKSQKFFVALQSYVMDNHDHPSTKRDIEDITQYLKKFGLDEKRSSPKFEKFLKEALNILDDLYNKVGLDLDLHLSNFGMRGEQIVFLDPAVDNDGIPMKLDYILKSKD